MARAKRRTGYQTYKDYYRQYAKTNAMREGMLSERSYNAFIRFARASGESTVNFSRNLAARQKQASSLQLRVTWGMAQEDLKASRERIKAARSRIKASIEDQFRKRGKAISKDDLNIRIDRILATDRDLIADINFVETYGNISWKEFKLKQRSVLALAKRTYKTRELWDEAFRLAFDSPSAVAI